MTSAPAAPPRPNVEHFGKPLLNGQRLPFSSAVRVGFAAVRWSRTPEFDEQR